MDLKSLSKKIWNDFIVPCIVGMLIGLTVNLFVGFTSVSGMSMYPTLNHKDFLYMSKISKDSATNGDIVVFDTTPEEMFFNKVYYIKRLIAKEGDHVVIKDGKVKVNDKELVEDYTDGSVTEGDVDVVVPQGKYFVLGDNRDGSTDSRVFGLVSQDNIVGVVKGRIFPFKSISNK